MQTPAPTAGGEVCAPLRAPPAPPPPPSGRRREPGAFTSPPPLSSSGEHVQGCASRLLGPRRQGRGRGGVRECGAHADSRLSPPRPACPPERRLQKGRGREPEQRGTSSGGGRREDATRRQQLLAARRPLCPAESSLGGFQRDARAPRVPAGRLTVHPGSPRCSRPLPRCAAGRR